MMDFGSIFNQATGTWLDYQKAKLSAQSNALAVPQYGPAGQPYVNGQPAPSARAAMSTTTMLLIGGGVLVVALLALKK